MGWHDSRCTVGERGRWRGRWHLLSVRAAGPSGGELIVVGPRTGASVCPVGLGGRGGESQADVPLCKLAAGQAVKL